MNESHRNLRRTARAPRRTQLSVTLDPDLREALARAAAAQHRTASNFVKLVLVEALAGRQAATDRSSAP